MAIIYQISLHGDAFDARGRSWADLEAESGCKRDREWKDPLLDRHMLETEFGCSVSHLRVWHKIANSGLNGIIFEEDAIFESIDVSHVDEILKHHDSAWLGYRKNTLGYWYNCHAYALTPETARLLIKGFSERIIPVDEWVPLTLLDHKKENYFFEPERVKQIPRSIRPSTIEIKQMKNHVLTVGTDEDKMWALDQSTKRHGINYINLGKGMQWHGGTMEGQGGGQKINLVRNHIQSLPDDDVVLFVDGYDVFFCDDLATISERFRGFNCDILFAAEKDCWPLANMASQFPMTPTPYKYLNSGVYMGKVRHLKTFFNETVIGDQDDQLWMQEKFLSQRELNIQLDYEGYIFQCNDDVSVRNGQIMNGMCCPCIYHGNGGTDAKHRFVNLAGFFDYAKAGPTGPEIGPTGPTGSNPLPPSPPSSPYYMDLDFEVVANDIIVTKFLTENQCQYLIDISENHGGWEPMPNDKFPAYEIRLKELGLWDEYERLWKEKLGMIAEQYWQPMQHYGLRDAFTMRYSVDTQKTLGFHTDASHVTGSVKLNDNYDGGVLIYPRQNFDNSKVAIGDCILFPSQVTHGHYVNELTSGVKYSLTMWTSRYKGDVNG